MGKKTLKYILPILWILCCALLFRLGFVKKGLMEAADVQADSSFLEELGSKSLVSYKIQDTQDPASPYGNIAVNKLRTGDRDGMDLTVNADGSVTVDGLISRKSGLIVSSPDHMRLQPGEYYLYAEGLPEDYHYIRIVFGTRVNEEDKYKFVKLTQEAGQIYPITIEEPCYCVYGIFVRDGYQARNLTLRFMLNREETKDYQPCPMTRYDGSKDMLFYGIFSADKERFRSYSNREYGLLYNNVRFQYNKKYDWITIDFGDGTGIQFLPENDGKGIYGKINHLGYVLEAAGSFEKQGNQFILPF